MGTEIIDVTKQGQTEAREPEEHATPEVAPMKRRGSPVSNEAYDVIAALHSKLQGLDAYRKYADDADAGLWEELTEIERVGICKLVDKLERLLKSSKFWAEGGSTH